MIILEIMGPPHSEIHHALSPIQFLINLRVIAIEWTSKKNIKKKNIRKMLNKAGHVVIFDTIILSRDPSILSHLTKYFLYYNY